MAGVNSAQAAEHEHPHHDKEFTTWTYCSEASWSFGALQRAVEALPRDIYRAKGIVRLDLETGDYGILQVTGKRGWLKLSEPESPETVPVSTELVFIGKPGTNTNESIGMVFEQALEDARAQDSEGYTVKDLRAFNVVFA
jgi:G3E family GTPase